MIFKYVNRLFPTTITENGEGIRQENRGSLPTDLPYKYLLLLF